MLAITDIINFSDYYFHQQYPLSPVLATLDRQKYGLEVLEMVERMQLAKIDPDEAVKLSAARKQARQGQRRPR